AVERLPRALLPLRRGGAARGHGAGQGGAPRHQGGRGEWQAVTALRLAPPEQGADPHLPGARRAAHRHRLPDDPGGGGGDGRRDAALEAGGGAGDQPLHGAARAAPEGQERAAHVPQGGVATAAAEVISTRDLTIRFGGHVAVDHVSLDVAPFTLKSIIGPNGAGKTTFFNLLSGQYRPTEGRVLFKGRDVTRKGAAARTRLGIGRSFQLTNVFPTLSVLENVRLAVQARRGLGFTAWRDYRRLPDLEDAAYGLLEAVLLEGKWSAT